MSGRRKWLGAAAAAALLGFAGFVGYGSWQTAQTLDSVLRVGSPFSQEGWPSAQRPADIGFRGDPMAAYGYAFEDVEVQTELGPAPAWLIAPAQGAQASAPWAIVVHGIGGRRENGYRFVPVLHEAGMPVLMITYRNDEDAPASADGLHAFGLTEWRDLDAAVAFATGRGARSVVLVAESMGGGIVGQFLGRSPRGSHVAAVALDAPALDFPATVEAQLRLRGLPMPGLLARGGLWLTTWRYPVSLPDAVVSDVMAAFTGPLFLSHGAADRVVPVATSDRLVEEREGPTEYLRTGAYHIQSWSEDPARYDAALRGFLESLPR